ncbi:MAG: Holliday junction branch migration protein RuvA [Candidatus Marinimicrobia bacterium]|nr:Holliday junction branch migration protein RuvA [Candidatus Neomarinimicrobiota bacterium]|tara:strand:+ start:1582 stop:2178 length:597 start_codon:yes stop_codon:yes gene_type:complete
MIYQVRGRLISKNTDFIVLEVGGVGLKISSTYNTIKRINEESEILLYTYLHVREDALDLYGFHSLVEKEVFLLLIGISGIGPKLANTILSGILPGDLKEKIISGDFNSLTSVPGVGSKTAKRIIVELKDKFTKIEDGSIGFSEKMDHKLYSDALNALSSLGYNSKQSKQTLDQLFNSKGQNKDNIEVIIKAALKKLSD